MVEQLALYLFQIEPHTLLVRLDTQQINKLHKNT